jgi:ADP-ribose pyrophosphatase YjhB (NUDIX family)
VTREILEETGLVVEQLQFLTTVDLVDREPDGRVRYHYTLVDFTAEAPLGDAVAGDDAVDVAWFAVPELAGLGLWSETLRIIGDAAALRRRPTTG